MSAKALAALVAASTLVGALCAPTFAETIAKGPVRLSVTAALAPKALPRTKPASVSVTLAGKISSAKKGTSPPQLKRIAFAINANGKLNLKGLPVCRIGHIQPATNQEAIEACPNSLVGTGAFAADVKLPEQSPFPSKGKMLAFNGRLRGQPAILAHIYGTVPASTSYTLPFTIKSTKGTYGPKLANGSVNTEKIAPEAVTGEKVNEGTLGQVPSANTASSASFADSANPAAFAKVDKAGNLDAVNSKSIASTTELEAGVYCVVVAGFSPRGAQVTPIFNGIGSSDAFARIGGAAACPSPQVEVQAWNGGVKVEAPFYLVAYR
jgi:hypothetical protein